MKKICIIMILLLLLTGCGRNADTVERPYSLTVGYQGSEVFAKATPYEWFWKNGLKTQSVAGEAVDPRAMLAQLPCVQAGDGQQIDLKFQVQPDKLLAECFSSRDGFESAVYPDLTESSLSAPSDGETYLYSVYAAWTDDRKASCWGSATYHFLYVPEGSSVPGSALTLSGDTGDLTLEGILQLDADQILGVEVTNGPEEISKTCRSRQDKTLILQFLTDSLAYGLEEVSVSSASITHALRLVTVGGSQLNVGYGCEGGMCWLTSGGRTFASAGGDPADLWASLQADAFSANASAGERKYLDVSEVFPGEAWGNEYVYGYVTALDETIRFDGARLLEASGEAGYELEKGWPNQSAQLAADCEFWFLENGHGPYCRVTAAELLQQTEQLPAPALFRIYTNNSKVIAVCQELLP